MSRCQMRTISGINFDLLDPQPEMYSIRDIAIGLSREGRFTNQTRVPYYVGHHCLLVSQFLRYGGPQLMLQGLLHDLSETYTRDLSTPFKAELGEYRVIEDRILERGLKRFGIKQWPLDPEVKEVDKRMLVTESYQLVNGDPEYWSHPAFSAKAYDYTIDPLCSTVVEKLFLGEFERLGGRA